MKQEELHDLLETEGVGREDAAEAFDEIYNDHVLEGEIAGRIEGLLASKPYMPDSEAVVKAVAEDMAREALGHAFMARNQLVTNADAGIEKGTTIVREPNDHQDGTHRLRVTSAPPEDARYAAVNVSKEKSVVTTGSPGVVKHGDRHSIESE